MARKGVWELLCLKYTSCMPEDGWMLWMMATHTTWFSCSISKWLHSGVLCGQCQVSLMKCLIIIKNENKFSEFTPPLAESAVLDIAYFFLSFFSGVLGSTRDAMATSARFYQLQVLLSPMNSKVLECPDIQTDPWLGSSGNHLPKLLRTWWRTVLFFNISEISSPTVNSD